jgi:L-histidine Nalpha-methyltransferase
MVHAAQALHPAVALAPARRLEEFAAEVRAGLTRIGQKELPSKYLYDDVGSALFEVITLLPEYGLTRAEQRILSEHADSIARQLPSPVVVAELGSGSGKKTRLILEALARRQPTTYHPIELSHKALVMCTRELDRIESVSIVGYEREYLEGLSEVAERRRANRRGEHLLVLFLGSSIGNFDRDPGEEFLRQIRQKLMPGDALLLGADLEKHVPTMILAYDDPAGVTAAFSLNLLARINRELDADFDLRQFRHVASYNSAERRIEVRLRSCARQTVAIRKAGFSLTLQPGETIWTESAHKYRRREILEMARRAGFRCLDQWADEEWTFAESLLVPE